MRVLKREIDNIYAVTKRLRATGFFSIFVSSIVTKLIALIGSIVIVRVLTKEDYGIYSLVLNNIALLGIINDCGFNVATMQCRSEHYKDPVLFNDYFTLGIKCGLLFSGIVSVLTLLSPLFYPFRSQFEMRWTQILCLLPLLNAANSFMASNLRVQLKNRKYASVNIFQSISNYAILVLLAYLWGVRGAILSNYIVAFALLVFSYMISKSEFKFNWASNCVVGKRRKDFFYLAFASQFNNSISALLHLFDIFLIGRILNSTSVASYKVASTIPQALIFIPGSLLIYIGPLFARNIGNNQWVKSSYHKMLKGCAVLNGIVVLGGLLIAPFMLPLLFGKRYEDVVICFDLLLLSYFMNGTFNIPSANVIYTQHKAGVNIVITVISNLANCILNVILIRKYGSVGAAYSTLFVSIIAGGIGFFYMEYWLNKK